MTTFDYILLGAAILILLDVVSSRASGRLGVPALLLFLVIGMLASSERVGGIEFDNAGVAQALGVVALIFILFSGGLDTRWTEVRPLVARWLRVDAPPAHPAARPHRIRVDSEHSR